MTFLISCTKSFVEIVPLSVIKCKTLTSDDEKLPIFWHNLIAANKKFINKHNIFKIGQNAFKLCHFQAYFKHFTTQYWQINSFVRKKSFLATNWWIFKNFVSIDIYLFPSIRFMSRNWIFPSERWVQAQAIFWAH